MTACHVVAKNFDTDQDIELLFHEKLQVIRTNAKSAVRARVLKDYLNRANDLALIVTEKPLKVDRVISYNFTDQVKPGQSIAALGFPSRSQRLTETVGNVMSFDEKGGNLEFDAEIAVGNSGGLLLKKEKDTLCK